MQRISKIGDAAKLAMPLMALVLLGGLLPASRVAAADQKARLDTKSRWKLGRNEGRTAQKSSRIRTGPSVETRANGTKIIRNTDGSSVEQRPDGTRITRTTDGTSVERRPDGTKNHNV